MLVAASHSSTDFGTRESLHMNLVVEGNHLHRQWMVGALYRSQCLEVVLQGLRLKTYFAPQLAAAVAVGVHSIPRFASLPIVEVGLVAAAVVVACSEKRAAAVAEAHIPTFVVVVAAAASTAAAAVVVVAVVATAAAAAVVPVDAVGALLLLASSEGV